MPGQNNGTGTTSAVVGVVSLATGLVVPLLLLGGAAGLWLAVRGRQRVVDGDADNPRVVLLGFVTSVAACGVFAVLLVVAVLGSTGVLGAD